MDIGDVQVGQSRVGIVGDILSTLTLRRWISSVYYQVRVHSILSDYLKGCTGQLLYTYPIQCTHVQHMKSA